MCKLKEEIYIIQGLVFPKVLVKNDFYHIIVTAFVKIDLLHIIAVVFYVSVWIELSLKLSQGLQKLYLGPLLANQKLSEGHSRMYSSSLWTVAHHL